MKNDSVTQTSRSLEGLNVLVVEDNRDARDLFALMLEMRGALVTTAASVAAALEMLAVKRFDLLVSDVHLPGESGITLVRNVRTSSDSRTLPALAITADWDPALHDELLRAGFQARLAKPFTDVQLVTELLLLIGEHRESDTGRTAGASAEGGS